MTEWFKIMFFQTEMTPKWNHMVIILTVYKYKYDQLLLLTYSTKYIKLILLIIFYFFSLFIKQARAIAVCWFD